MEEKYPTQTGFSGLEDWFKSLGWVGVGLGITLVVLLFNELLLKKRK